MKKISVIVPIYNVEQYLKKCLDSLVNQTLKDIELILVNDASPDNSDTIMKEYAEKYDNIKTLYLPKNRCLGGARNAGIEVATGKYIMFVDSDDYLDLDYCEKMYDAMERTGSEFAYSAYKTMDESYMELGEKLTYPIAFSGELTLGKKRGVINKGVFAWGKMYSLELWKKLELTFPEHLKYEDAPTIPIYILHCAKCCFVEGTYYRYLIRQTSIVRTRNTGHDDAQQTALLFADRMKKYGLYEKFAPEVEHFMVQRYYCVFLRRCVQMYDEIPYEKMRETREQIRNWYPEFEKGKYYYTFVAEDRYRMLMNDISPYTCAMWEKKYQKSMQKDEEFYATMYYPFYESKREIISRMLKEKRTIALWGDQKKRKAFEDFLLCEHQEVKVIQLADRKTLQEIDPLGIDAFVGVNPSACLTLYYDLKEKKSAQKLLNLEDILNGYIEEV